MHGQSCLCILRRHHRPYSRKLQQGPPTPNTLQAVSQCCHLLWRQDHGSRPSLQYGGRNLCNLCRCAHQRRGKGPLILIGLQSNYLPLPVEKVQGWGERPHASCNDTMEAAHLGLWKGEEKEGAPSWREMAGPWSWASGTPSTCTHAGTAGKNHFQSTQVTLGWPQLYPGGCYPSKPPFRIDERPVLPPPSSTEETTLQHWGQIVLNLKGMVLVLPHGAPALNAPANHWCEFIKWYQMACLLSNCGGLYKMFPGTISSDQYPDDEDTLQMFLYV